MPLPKPFLKAELQNPQNLYENMNQPSDKTTLRRHFAALRDSLPPEERTAAENLIRDRLFSLPAWKHSPLICGYMSTRSELDMMPIWERAVAEGKSYALPVTVTNARAGQMIFRRLPGFCPHTLISARFGISEPSEACPALSLQDFSGALILVPGLAFDEDGFRVGYGGGYYDRFLAALRQSSIPVTTVGLLFSVCRAERLPRESHDIPVDYLLDNRL